MQRYSEDSIRVGDCRVGENLMNCTGGCNEYQTGNGCAACSKNQDVSVRITCADQGDIVSSCLEGNQLCLKPDAVLENKSFIESKNN